MGQSVSSKMNNGTNTDLLDYLSQFGIENNESTIENQQMSLIQQNDDADNSNNTSGNNSSTPTSSSTYFTTINDVAATTATTPVTPITTREAIIDPIIDQFPSMPPKRDNGSGNNINNNTTAEMNALVSQTRSTSPIRPVSAPVVAPPATYARPAPVTTTHFTPVTPPTAPATINTTNVTSTTRTSIKMVGVNNTNNVNGNNDGNVDFTSQPPHTGRKIQISLSTVANKGSMSIHVPQHNVTNEAAAATQTITNQAPQVPQAPADPALGIPESQYDYFFKLSGTEERFKNKWIETIEKAKISKKRNYVVHTIRSGRFRVTETGMEMLPTTVDTSQSSVTDLLSTQWN